MYAALDALGSVVTIVNTASEFANLSSSRPPPGVPGAVSGLPLHANPPHAYAIALESMLARAPAEGCVAYVVIEDDVAAGPGWSTAVLAAQAALKASDPDWVLVKLFVPAELEGWDFY